MPADLPVYNYIHIGNARPICVFDTLRRYLEYRGYEVTFVQNFTDVDDKLIKKANEEGITVKEVAERYIKEYITDAEGLGIRPATFHPRATENMDKIIEIVKTLVDKGYAYARQTEMSTSAPRSLTNTASSPTCRWRNWNPVPVSQWASRKKTLWISPSGRPLRPASPPGIPPGERAVRAGTLSAPL